MLQYVLRIPINLTTSDWDHNKKYIIRFRFQFVCFVLKIVKISVASSPISIWQQVRTKGINQKNKKRNIKDNKPSDYIRIKVDFHVNIKRAQKYADVLRTTAKCIEIPG